MHRGHDMRDAVVSSSPQFTLRFLSVPFDRFITVFFSSPPRSFTHGDAQKKGQKKDIKYVNTQTNEMNKNNYVLLLCYTAWSAWLQ